MKKRPSSRRRLSNSGVLLLALAAVFALIPSTASASGLLIADGGLGGLLEIEEQRVEVVINNGIAVTTVTQVFRNKERRQVEALYMFPVPKGASVSNFSMWINGKEMIGEVVEKERAREIYESYKAKNVDPGLLEQVDFKTFEMRIFPIGPEAAQRVQLTYYQELSFDHDWATWVYPLATKARPELAGQTTGTFALDFHARSEVPIVELESPSHPDSFVVAHHSEGYVQASMEANGVELLRDFVLAYRVSRPQTGIDLLTTQQPGEDGYFMLTLTAGEDLKDTAEGMDYLFVLDVSGSMRDEGKMLMSRDAIEAFVNELGDEDRVELMSFNIQPTPMYRELMPLSERVRRNAGAFLRELQPRGGTSLQPAMELAFQYGDPDRTLNVVVLSDGLTEEANRATLLRTIGQRPGNTRVFCIGVGNDVNRALLEQMADDAGGLAAFLSRDDNLERQARAFRRKLIRPAVTNLQVTRMAGVEIYDLEPRTIPNLYHGSPLRVFGRYRKGGTARFRCRGELETREFELKGDLAFARNDPANPEIERMWAWHRMDRLLKQADRNGDRAPVVEEIIRLGEAYSIVSEYTSFLVLENDREYQRWGLERRNLLRTRRDREAQLVVAERLEDMRRRQVVDLGPVEREEPPQLAAPQGHPSQARPQADSGTDNQATNQPERRRSNGGSGPVGPLFLALLALARRLGRKGHRPAEGEAAGDSEA